MDLQYLLLLQNFRNAAGSFLITPMLLISDFATYGSAACCIVIYWAVSRELGYWFVTNCVVGFFINNLLKLTACVYRPWIRLPQIEPPAKALESATGYSFPSGHTQTAASFFGSCAFRKGEDRLPLKVACIVLILLTGFSRNFLGVHTPQDVLASMACAAVLIWALRILFSKIEQTPSIVYPAAVAGIVIVILAVVYFQLKTYPMDYMDGALIVDPEIMKEDGFTTAGMALGFFSGVLVEVRFIRFKTEGTVLRRILRVLLGIPLPIVHLKVIKPIVYNAIGELPGHLVVYGILIFYVVALYPAMFSAVQKRLDNTKTEET